MDRSKFALLVGWTGAFLLSGPCAPAQDFKAALEDLLKAERARDPSAFSFAAKHILQDDSQRAVREVCEAYGRLVSEKPPLEAAEHFHLHSELARALSDVRGASGVEEIDRQREKSGSFYVRICCLDAAGFQPKVFDLPAAAIASLQDKTPPVVRRALFYLRNDRRLLVLDAVLARYLEVDLPKGPKGGDWDRLRLAFQSTLRSLLRVSLNAAVDYKNYVEPRRSLPDQLFDRPEQPRGPTKLQLFGLDVTGNNIAFIIDVSGSMLSTDPVPLVGEPGKTETAEKTRVRRAQMVEERRRINRAKKELTKVVQALPDGKKYNIIAYSTEVVPWKKLLQPMNAATRKDAVEYVAGLKADGITVTDEALEFAFTDLAVDTIYLITDGAPTHVGTRGPELPPDAEDIIRKIHKRVGEINYFRGVRIFTLGFPEAEENFLKKLAADNAGEYAPIQ